MLSEKRRPFCLGPNVQKYVGRQISGKQTRKITSHHIARVLPHVKVAVLCRCLWCSFMWFAFKMITGRMCDRQIWLCVY